MDSPLKSFQKVVIRFFEALSRHETFFSCFSALYGYGRFSCHVKSWIIFPFSASWLRVAGSSQKHLCFAPSILQCILVNGPVPGEEKVPYNVTLLAMRFTVGMVVFGWKDVLGFCQTLVHWFHFFWPFLLATLLYMQNLWRHSKCTNISKHVKTFKWILVTFLKLPEYKSFRMFRVQLRT